MPRDAAITRALIRLVASADTVTLPSALISLSRTCASVSFRITLSADAPAPLIPTPVVPPSPAPTEAARLNTLMLASDFASTWTVFADVSLAPSNPASTEPSITLRARETPIDSATPVVPPKATASVDAAATDLMVD